MLAWEDDWMLAWENDFEQFQSRAKRIADAHYPGAEFPGVSAHKFKEQMVNVVRERWEEDHESDRAEVQQLSDRIDELVREAGEHDRAWEAQRRSRAMEPLRRRAEQWRQACIAFAPGAGAFSEAMKDSDARFREQVEPRVRPRYTTSYVWRTSGVPSKSHGRLALGVTASRDMATTTGRGWSRHKRRKLPPLLYSPRKLAARACASCLTPSVMPGASLRRILNGSSTHTLPRNKSSLMQSRH